MKRRNPHEGSSFESFLEEQGLRDELVASAIKAVVAWQLTAAMKAQKITKTAMAKRLATSRSQLDRLLDPKNEMVTLRTLAKAARVLGKRVQIVLENAA